MEHTTMMSRIIAHVTVVRAFQSQQTGRPLYTARDVVVGQLHHGALFVHHLHRKAGNSLLGREVGTVGCHPQGIRTPRSTDGIGGNGLTIGTASLSHQQAGLIGDVPMDDATFGRAGLHGSYLTTVQQKACLRRIGIADHTYGLAGLVVPAVPGVG